MNYQEIITIEPGKRSGKPCIIEAVLRNNVESSPTTIRLAYARSIEYRRNTREYKGE